MWLTWQAPDWMSELQREAVIDGMAEALIHEAEDYLYWRATGEIR